LVIHHQFGQSFTLSSCVSSCIFGFFFLFLIFLWGKKWVTL
jgi:hypothetical protein